MTYSQKKDIKAVLDLGRKYIMARAMEGGIGASEKEMKALDSVSKMLGAELDPQRDGSMNDVIVAMEEKAGIKPK